MHNYFGVKTPISLAYGHTISGIPSQKIPVFFRELSASTFSKDGRGIWGFVFRGNSRIPVLANGAGCKSAQTKDDTGYKKKGL